MALIYNYNLAGIGSNVQFGLSGGFIEYDPTAFTLFDKDSNLADLVIDNLRFNSLSDGAIDITAFSNDITLGGLNPSVNLLPTEFAIKTYIDNANIDVANVIDTILANSVLTYLPDVGGNLEVKLATEVFTIQGGTNITTSGAGQTLTIALDNDINVSSLTVSQDAIISGNLTVSGNVTNVNTIDLYVEDPIIRLASNNSISDILDIGFVGHYSTDGSNVLHTGLLRDATDGKFKLITDLTQDLDGGTTVVDFSTGNVATLVANLEGSITIGNIEVSTIVDSTLGIANNINDFSIPTTQAIAEFVETVGDGLLLRSSFTADGINTNFDLGSGPNVVGKDYYVDKVVLTVSSAFTGGNVSHVLIKQGNVDLIALDDSDISVADTYFIGLSGDTPLLSNNVIVGFYEIDGTTPSIPTAGNIVVNVHYNWV